MAGNVRAPVVFVISSLNELAAVARKCLPAANITNITPVQPGLFDKWRFKVFKDSSVKNPYCLFRLQIFSKYGHTGHTTILQRKKVKAFLGALA